MSAKAASILRGAACLVSSPQDTAEAAGRRSRPARGAILRKARCLNCRTSRSTEKHSPHVSWGKSSRPASGQPVSTSDREPLLRKTWSAAGSRASSGWASESSSASIPTSTWRLHLMVAGRLHWKKPGAPIPRGSGLAAFDFPSGTLILTEAGSRAAGGAAHPLWTRGPGEARSGWPGGDRFDLP